MSATHTEKRILKLLARGLSPDAIARKIGRPGDVSRVIATIERERRPEVRHEATPIKTKHTDTCSRVFKNYDLTCPRCKELDSGASPRPGWGRGERDISEEIRKHDCKKSNCGPVCTAFEW